MNDSAAVEAAAVELIAAFAANDRPRYFAAFVPEATFIFPSTDRVLDSRAAYEAEWQSWIDEFKFDVIDCISSNRVVNVLGDVAVFTHQTVTYLSVADGNQTLHERETIIFHKIDGKWFAVHEHLSALPG
jgi:ketosteroid isomerase-like protein